jgi:hypothetical protein
MSKKWEYGVPIEVPPPGSGPSNGFFEAIFAVAAIFLFGFCITMAYYGLKSSDWKSTQGQVISSKVIMEQDDSGDISSRRTIYKPEVVYSYSVIKQKLTSNEINPPLNYSGTYFNGAWQTEDVLQKYPLNSAVTVFYNPEDPGQACLEPGINYSTFSIIFVFSLIFAVVPLWRPFKRLSEKMFPSKPYFTVGKDGRRVFLSSFRDEQQESLKIEPPKERHQDSLRIEQMKEPEQQSLKIDPKKEFKQDNEIQ